MANDVKILVIDDDPDVVFAVTAMLTAEGFNVLTAENGSEGLDRVRLDHPDLILLDLMIESHDTGFQLAKTLKGDPATRDIPVIMVSSVREKTGFGFDQGRDGHWMKTDAFLEKPYEPAVVIAKIRELLAARGGRV